MDNYVSISKITFFNNDKAPIYLTNGKAESIVSLLEQKDGSQNYVTIDGVLIHLSTIAGIEKVSMVFKDLPENVKKDYLAENPKTLRQGGSPLGAPQGNVNRCFNVRGEQIKCPFHTGRNQSKDNRPEDYVEIVQTEYMKMVSDPYGNDVESYALGEPVEERYIGWRWENETWYPSVYLVIKGGVINEK